MAEARLSSASRAAILPVASPVRWIETRDLFIGQYKFERFIEIGHPQLSLVWPYVPSRPNTRRRMTQLA
ncbi:hypothetical protein BGW80DRAFT_1358549, partial [Lactifluus volemus]